MLICVNKVEALEPKVELFSSVYWNVFDGSKLHSDKMGFITIDDRVVYCLNPFKVVGKDYNINEFDITTISNSDLEYIKLVADYSELSVQNKVMDSYLAAQEIIWERLVGEDSVIWSSEKNEQGIVRNVDTFKNDILKNIDDFYTKPSFDESTITGNYFDTLRIEDKNHVLHNYDIFSANENSVWIEGDYLNIYLNDDAIDVKLIRKEGSGNPTYYFSEEKQELADMYSEVQIESNIHIRANDKYHESININFKDKKTGNLLSDIINFDIINCNTNEIYNYSTSNGYFLTDLKEGVYKISAVDVPFGYLNFEDYSFQVSKVSYNNYKTLNIFVDDVIGKLIVNNYTDSFFKIFSYDNFINTPDLPEMNNFELELPLGSYYLLDGKSNKRYDFDLIYKDAFTPIIYYYLDIYEETDDQLLNEKIAIGNKEIAEEDYKEKTDKNTIDYLPNTTNYYRKIIIVIGLLFLLSLIIPKHEK